MTEPALRLAVVRASYTAFGGAERIVNRIVRTLAERGLAVTVLARSWSSDATETLPPSVQWRRLDPFYLGGLWRQWSFARAVRQELARTHFDLVQSHERIIGVGVYRAGDGVHREWLAQRARARGWLHEHLARLSPQHAYQLRAERQMFADPRLRAVVCNSQLVRGQIRRWFDVPADKLVLIRNGVDSQVFHPASADERAAARAAFGLDALAPVFCFVGSGFERKGLAVALRALARVPGAILLIAGRDRRQARYERLAQALGAGGRARFLGGLADVRAVYHAADAFVLPTLYDPQPNAALEAMASGLPLVTSTQCGAAELLEEGGGFVSDALDVNSVAAAMQSLAGSVVARGAGELARRAILPYTLQRMTDEYLALYQRLLAGADRTP